MSGVPHSIKTALKINSGEPRIEARRLPSNVVRVLRGLHRGGYRACVVGGGVRDLLLNLQPKDFDIVTDARPEQVKKLFRRVLLIGRRFRLAHVMFGREYIEVATFRGSDHAASDTEDSVVHGSTGRILRDNRFGSLEEDVLRRDFTVNALYWDFADKRIIDHVGGLKDIAARRLRLIGEPRLRFEEDPVRMLRAARFAAKLGCRLDSRCAELIPSMAGLLRAEPPARLLEEVRKLFLGGHAVSSFGQLRSLGLLGELFPFLSDWMKAEPNSGDFIGDALAATDRRLSEGSHASLMFLLCVFYWGPVSRAAAADKSRAPRYSQITEAFRRMIQAGSHGMRPTRKMMADMEEVLGRQASLEAQPRRRVGQTLAHPLFRPAYRLLRLRRRLGEIDEQCVLYWEKRAGSAPSRSWSKRRPDSGRPRRPRRAKGNAKDAR